MKTCVFFSVLLTLFSSRAFSAQILSDNQLRSEVLNILRWKVFWEGTQSLPHYKAGLAEDAVVVSSSLRMAVFIGDIQAVIYLTMTNGEVSDRVIAGMNSINTTSAVNKFLSDETGMAGFALKPGAPEHLNGASVREESKGPVTSLSAKRGLHFRLPDVELPGYVVARNSPRELDALKGAVRNYVTGFHESRCGPASVFIPFFSAQDPTVFVYVELGDGCGSGIFPFKRIGDRWNAGQFSPARSPNAWTYTIGQIRRFTLAHFDLP